MGVIQMQIVIDIPEEEYNRIQSMDWKNGDAIYDEAVKAIHYGKPLPKDHGRLIDADAQDDIISRLNELRWELTRADYKLIDNVLFEFPTIIEASEANTSHE